MIYRSKAPLRIGLAGGGTDVSPYSDLYGGAILNASVSLYAHATIEPLAENTIILQGLDRGEEQTFEVGATQSAGHGAGLAPLPIDGTLDLLKGVYNRLLKEYGGGSGGTGASGSAGSGFPKGFRLSTFVDAPAGSGLGTSSTLVVAIIGVFAEMLRLPLGEYDMAHLAYDIERVDLRMAGGRQDQYAATFGGVNYMEFYGEDKVIVNPLRVKQQYLFELENNLLLYYTSTSRESAKIIEKQSQNVVDKKEKSIEAMHQLKHQAQLMKEALLKGRIHEIGEILDFGFRQKQQMAEGISNPLIDDMYDKARKAGATGGKISGAGGGGFMTFYCPGISKYRVMEALSSFGGYCKPYQFTDHGLTSWTI
jgi:D-glycero-alpha-D-manno-heptose-7-phosphate kinase